MKQLLLIALLTSGAAFAAAPASPFPAVPDEENIKFDREAIHNDCEGEYFRIKATPTIYGAQECFLKQKNQYWRYRKTDPYINVSAQPWPGQKEFLVKLKLLELFAQNPTLFKTQITKDRGSSNGHKSVITDKFLGYFPFEDHQHNVSWIPGLSTHYIELYNVLPSRTFYRYVHAKAAEFGATTMAEAEKSLAKSQALVAGQQTAFGLLPWNDPIQQQRIVDLLAPLVAQYASQYGNEPFLWPFAWAQQVIPQAKKLCPELTGERASQWNAGLYNLRGKYEWLRDLLRHFESAVYVTTNQELVKKQRFAKYLATFIA